jgi:hypothetical protein
VKKGLIWACVVLLLSGCSFITRKNVLPIDWPEKIEYMEALCDLDMAWKDMQYSGSMSLKLSYPDTFQLEVYGPFGDTIVYMKKAEGAFLLAAGDERFSNEKAFERKFDISLKDFMDDITLRGPIREGPSGRFTDRGKYKVLYNVGEKGSRFCWEGTEGSICMRFLEARFSRE